LDTDIRLLELEPSFEELTFRVPLKFGTGVIRAITSLTVRARVETRRGKVADGYGNILLSDVWAFPSPELSHEKRDHAMRRLAEAACRLLLGHGGIAHPVDLFMEVKQDLPTVAAQVAQNCGLGVPIPILAALVCASPADAAIHDAFGRANGICTYDGYGPEFMAHDLSTWCGPAFKGRHIADYLHRSYKHRLPIFHLVGGMDKLTAKEITADDPVDGLPVSLDQWIARDGLRCFKVKLRGTDIAWDVQRTADVARVIGETREALGLDGEFWLSTDSNEMNESPETVLEYLHRLKEASPVAYERLLYLEQPTERDLNEHRYDMRGVAALKPVVVDEGVTDLEKLRLAQELGWSGVGLKTCKGHTSSLLYLVTAREAGMVVTVQDLTNPGRSLVHSVGLAARIDTLMGVEYNSRQYLPGAAPEVRAAHPSLFTVQDGTVSTESIRPLGLGYGV
jgi:L-alanine-DL-glutamate epimerase-like enolase superfamily enzyme